jgi:hypothetical protein
MTPRGIVLGLLLAAVSSPGFTQQPDAQDYFGRAVTCCIESECQKLQAFVWRHAPYGVDIMMDEEDWCPVRLHSFPLTRAFDGVPNNLCELLICFRPEGAWR